MSAVCHSRASGEPARRGRLVLGVCVFSFFVLASGAALAAQSAAPLAAPRPDDGETIAAVVDGRPVLAREVERLVRQATAGAEQVNPAVLPLLKAQALDELVKRRLVLAYARQARSGATEAELDAALAEMKTSLKAQGRALEDWLAAQRLSAEELRAEFRWKLTWQKYLARYLTDERRRACFEAHRRELDGTQVVVSQILLRPEPDAGPEALAQLVDEAEALRKRILAGEVSFEEAARKHSAAPSAQAGGKLGAIRRRGAMVEAFAQAAFALEPGRISPPVRTQFGMHLIRCDGVEPGNKQWTEARAEIDQYLERELLERLAEFQAPRTPPQYTGRVPYLKFGTRELVVP